MSHFEGATDASKVVGAPGVAAVVVSVDQNRRKLGLDAGNLCSNHIVVARARIGPNVGAQYKFFSCSQPSAKRVADTIGEGKGEGGILAVGSVPRREIQRAEQVGIINRAGGP